MKQIMQIFLEGGSPTLNKVFPCYNYTSYLGIFTSLEICETINFYLTANTFCERSLVGTGKIEKL